MYQKIINKFRSLNKNQILIGLTVLAVVAMGILVFVRPIAGSSNMLSLLRFNSGSSNAIAQKAVEYLNANVLQQGQKATLISASEDSGVIKFKIDIQGKQYDSYMTKNGKLIFPEGITVEKNVTSNQPSQNQPNTQQLAPAPTTPTSGE